MLFSLVSSLSLAAVAAAASNPFFQLNSRIPLPPPIGKNTTTITSNSTGVFTQLLNHDAPHLGTFSQRFWYSTEYYKGPGSPVVLFTPGEIAADLYTGYLTNRTITGLFAQAIGGAVIMLEHRYWGESSPYDVLSTANLQYLTIEQAVGDLTYFAENVQLPFDESGDTNAPNAPWIVSGGSYSGALSAWTESLSPGTFWAYHASSAPVEAVYDYWQYFYPVQQGMATNCSTDFAAVIEYVDNTLENGTDEEVLALKTKFGLQGVEHNDDFADILATGPYLWQSNSFYTGYSEFFQFCDAVENVTAGAVDTPGRRGVGVEVALESFAYWMNSTVLPDYCASYGYEEWSDTWNVDCFDTYNATSPLYTDLTVSNPINRQWMWFLCNEPLAYWQDGAPENTTTLVSRLVTPEYWQRQCGLYFPEAGSYWYGSAEGKTTEDFNVETRGWNLTNTTRLIWTNGEFDPWRTSGVSSQFREGGQLQPTIDEPIQIIPGGFHCSDLIAENGAVNAGVQEVIDNETAQIKAWVDYFYEIQPNSTSKFNFKNNGRSVRKSFHA